MNNQTAQTPAEGSVWTTIAFGLCAVILVVCIIYDPGRAFDATLQGLSVWWHIVFPALLPFLVLTEMLIAYGFVHGFGALLDPLLRRLLGVPGEAGYIFPLGLIAGFPAAAEAAAHLHRQGRITEKEASRLAASAFFCSPMLLIVVIGTGFMRTPALGVLLAAIHIVAGIAAAMTMALFHRSGKGVSSLSASAASSAANDPGPRTAGWPRSIVHSMENARRLDGRSFGRLLGDTVSVSVQALMRIGGYILIFALVIQVLSRALPKGFPDFILPALFEVHLGSFQIAEADFASSALQAALLGAALGWGGLCGFVQVRAALKPAGIGGSGSFLLNRLLHGAYAYLLTLLLWKPVVQWFPGARPAYRDIAATKTAAALAFDRWPPMLPMLGMQAAVLAALVGSLLLFAWLWRRVSRIN